MEDLIEAVSPGIFRIAGAPVYGKQDLGYAPDGAVDQFAMETGNIMLRNPETAAAFEMIHAPKLRFKTDCCFITTGGAYTGMALAMETNSSVIEHAVVYFAPAGSLLIFGHRKYGLRTYLCLRKVSDGGTYYSGRRRGIFSDIARWPDPRGRVRILRGPEHTVLSRPEQFADSVWTCTTAMSDMGIRIAGGKAETDAPLETMISAPVGDGTIQLTSNGPIILLRDRQTCGGYPRIFNVISSDVDLLAQYQPFQHIRFQIVSIESARKIGRLKAADISQLKSRFC